MAQPAHAPTFDQIVAAHGLPRLVRGPVTTVQLNVTLRCNLACHHCHVESSPKRKETMSPDTIERILALVEASPRVRCVDVTGGAPEMHPQFRELVASVRALGRSMIDRCNLTILFEPGYEDIAELLAKHRVAVVASLPCYTKDNVEKQRGKNVFDRSIEGLRILNRLGYGREPGLALDLVYNPLGAFLPPEQATLEQTYRDELRELFDIEFDRLLTITNMPIQRFGDMLRRRGQYSEYLSLLVNHFNADAVGNVMCRDLVSIAHDGTLYDCDFNHALALPLSGRTRSIWDIESFEALEGEPIATAEHCFGCTAGAGSSCGGALV
jgi:radical SAM/Cys-rich protein